MISRGQIYWVQLDPTIGSEIKKTRPALIVSNDINNRVSDTVTITPLTSQTKTIRPFEVLLPAGIGGLKVGSKVKANQIRTIDKKRITSEAFGPTISQEHMDQVSQAIKIHLDIM